MEKNAGEGRSVCITIVSSSVLRRSMTLLSRETESHCACV